MNPVRSFAPAFWNHNFVMHWVNSIMKISPIKFNHNFILFPQQVYWIAPLLSAAVTSITYKSFFMPSRTFTSIPSADSK